MGLENCMTGITQTSHAPTTLWIQIDPEPPIYTYSLNINIYICHFWDETTLSGMNFKPPLPPGSMSDSDSDSSGSLDHAAKRARQIGIAVIWPQGRIFWFQNPKMQ